MVVSVPFVLLSERFRHSKSIPGSRLWQNKSLGKQREKKEISGFVEYLATLAPDPGLFFGFTCVQGNVSHVSTLLSPCSVPDEHSVSCGFGYWCPGSG